MRVGIYRRTTDGIQCRLTYTLDGRNVLVDPEDAPTHKTFLRHGIRMDGHQYYPQDGKKFLTALLKGYKGTYSWAEEVKEE